MTAALQLHRFLPRSRANGPGLRAVVWLQGCSLSCPGCFNPETHPFAGGERWAVRDLLDAVRLAGDAVQGLTITGGEPLQQRAGLTDFLRRVREATDLSVVLFTGFTWEEIVAFPDSGRLLDSVDVLIAGRYDAARRVAAGMISSANKTVHYLTDRYAPADLADVPSGEIILGADGTVTLSGIDPVRW